MTDTDRETVRVPLERIDIDDIIGGTLVQAAKILEEAKQRHAAHPEAYFVQGGDDYYQPEWVEVTIDREETDEEYNARQARLAKRRERDRIRKEQQEAAKLAERQQFEALELTPGFPLDGDSAD